MRALVPILSVLIAGCVPGWGDPGDGLAGGRTCLDAPEWFLDQDLDGFGDVVAEPTDCGFLVGFSQVGGDCDDHDRSRFPGADELADDGIDQDCDGVDATACWLDADRDGYGIDFAVIALDGSCDAADREASEAGDCDDGDDSVHPGGLEVADDGIDQDCNQVDATACHPDLDGDGFGAILPVLALDGACDPATESTVGGDCDDTLDTVYPGASESPDDGIDQDCSGTDTVSCHIDYDRDGWGIDATLLVASGECRTSLGYADVTGDCLDTDATVHPDAPEVVDDGIDQDCDGVDRVSCYEDGDGDGYAGTLVLVDGACDLAAGQALVGDDCDDALEGVHPGAVERCDGIDGDCDPLTLDDGLIAVGVADFTDLPTALLAAADGDRVAVCAGIWPAVVLDRPLHLVGVEGAASTVIDAAGGSSALTVLGGAVEVEGFTLTGGTGTLLPSEEGAGGGALLVGTEPVTLRSCVVADNTADTGAGVYVGPDAELVMLGGRVEANVALGDGGGLRVDGTADITASGIHGNEAARGGGLRVDGLATLRFASLVDNTAAGPGGAVLVLGEAELGDLSVTGNAATDGGALAVMLGGVAAVEAVTFVGNTATGGGGAVWIGGEASVRGVAVEDGTAGRGAGLLLAETGLLTLETSSFRRNVATGPGGGLWIGGEVTVDAILLEANQGLEGGGAFLTSAARATLTDVSAFDGAAAVRGGGLLLDGEAVLDSVAAERNTAGEGAGLFVRAGSDVSVLRGSLRDNVAAGDGGALWVGDGVVSEVELLRNQAARGAGVFVRPGADVWLRASTMRENVASEAGGGVWLGAPALVEQLELTGNVATDGGGIAIDGVSTSLIDVALRANTALDAGGGLWIEGGAVEMVGGDVSENAAVGGGGAWLVDGTLTGASLLANDADWGGGAYLSGGAGLFDSAVRDNAAQGGGGLFVDGDVGMADVDVRRNVAGQGAGLMLAPEASVVTESVAIAENAATEGGGVFLSGGSTLIGGSLSLNTAATGGGLAVVDVVGSPATVQSVTAFWNLADQGAGMAVIVGDALATDVTLRENQGDQGGGLYVAGDLLLDQGRVQANTASAGAGAWVAAGRLTASSVDWGTGADANSPDDVWVPISATSLDATGVASFLCDGSTGSCW